MTYNTRRLSSEIYSAIFVSPEMSDQIESGFSGKTIIADLDDRTPPATRMLPNGFYNVHTYCFTPTE